MVLVVPGLEAVVIVRGEEWETEIGDECGEECDGWEEGGGET